MVSENDEEMRRRDLDYEEQRGRIAKLQEEADYIRTQRRFYPFVVLSGTAAALLAFAKFVF